MEYLALEWNTEPPWWNPERLGEYQAQWGGIPCPGMEYRAAGLGYRARCVGIQNRLRWNTDLHEVEYKAFVVALEYLALEWNTEPPG